MNWANLVGVGILGAVGFVAYNQFKSQSDDSSGQLVGSPEGNGGSFFDFSNIFGDSPFNQGAGSSDIVASDVNQDSIQSPDAVQSGSATKKEMSAAEQSYGSMTQDVVMTGFGADGRVVHTGAGRGVAVEVTSPASRSGERSGVMIPDPITGELKDSRQTFLTSYRPIGISTTSSPQSQSAIDKPAGTLSSTPSNPTKKEQKKRGGKYY